MTIQATDEPHFRVPDIHPERALEGLSPAEIRKHRAALAAVTEPPLSPGLAELLREYLARLRRALAVDSAAVLLPGDGDRTLRVRASTDGEAGVEHEVEVRFGEGLAGAVASRRHAAIVDDLSSFGVPAPSVRGLASVMVAPLMVDGELVGVVHAGTRTARRFTAPDLCLLQMTADRVAPLVRSAAARERRTEQAGDSTDPTVELRNREARWRILAEVDPNGIFVMDDQSTILTANRAVERIFGYPAEELIGQPMSMLIPERLREAHRAGVQRYLATGRRNVPWGGVELPGLTRDGREVPLEIAFGEYMEGGRHVFAGFVQDLSARKREEARRTAEHGVTRILASNAPPQQVGLLSLQTICEALGWELGTFWGPDSAREELRCQVVWHRPDPGLAAFAEVSRATTLSRGAGLPGRVWRDTAAAWVSDVVQDDNFPRAPRASEAGLHAAFAFPILVDGEVEAVMEFYAREVQEPDESLLGTMEVIGHDLGQYLRRRRAERERDRALADAIAARELAEGHAVQLEEVQSELEMTNDELKRANEDLLERTQEAERDRVRAEEANRAKAEFLASMSHELRTPLNAVMGYTDLIRAGIPETPPAGTLEQVERISLASRHLLSLIEEILSFARLESGSDTLHVVPFDACELVDEVQAIMEPIAAEKGLEVRVVTPEGPLPMTSDPRKLRQVLINLLDNAVKFTEDGRVDLLVWTETDEVYFRIQDTGPGIAAEHRRKIFEPFWQADQSSTRTAGGTGLGLAVTLRLARALGGEVTVESESGRGTTFTVRLPQEVTPAAGSPADPPQGHSP